jgi:hypothetical protein
MAKKHSIGVPTHQKRTRKKRKGRWFKKKRKGYTRKIKRGQGKPI